MPALLIQLVSLVLMPADMPASSNLHLQGWEALDLVHHDIAETNVYIEPGLESLLPQVNKHLLAARYSRQLLFQDVHRRKAALETINQLLGIEEPNHIKQNRIIDDFSRILRIPINPLYLVRQTSVKKILRSDQSLPGFTYDPQTDQVTYLNQFKTTSEEGSSAWPLTLPLAEDAITNDRFEALKALQQFTTSPAIIIHEVTEIILVDTIRPTDPYCRWFHDGVADAITYEVLKRHQGNSAVQAYFESRDPSQFEVAEQQINLRYWPAINHALLDNHVPLEALSDLNLARYGYALREILRLIDRYDFSIIARIVKTFGQRQSRNGSDLFTVIHELTGEDLTQRFQRYQDFSNLEEGRKHYASAYNRASASKDYAAMLHNLNYLYELDLTQMDPGPLLQSRGRSATLLFHLGYPEYAEEMMQRCMEYFSRHMGDQGRQAAEEQFMQFSLACKRPQQAVAIAERHIELYPGPTTNIARIVKMTAAQMGACGGLGY